MISLCITTHNRDSLTVQSFSYVQNDNRISEIVIVDDCSDERIYNNLAKMVKGIPKVKLYRNEKNLDCYRNKREAVSKSSNEWVIILDSDNVIKREYLDSIPENLSLKTVYQPSFARPHFNFTEYSGKVISRHNVARYMHDDRFKTMLNAMNYLVNRDEYLKVWDGSIDPVTSDSIFQNYNWLNKGNSIYVVPGMEYEHLVHNGSHYQNNVRRTPSGFHQSIEIKLKNL